MGKSNKERTLSDGEKEGVGKGYFQNKSTGKKSEFTVMTRPHCLSCWGVNSRRCDVHFFLLRTVTDDFLVEDFSLGVCNDSSSYN